jgi:hypothetical protein
MTCFRLMTSTDHLCSARNRRASTKSITATALLALLSGSVAPATSGAGKVTVQLTGDIAPECAIGGGLSSGGASSFGVPLQAGDITRPGRRDYGFTVNCNTPFTYRLEAQYGALTNTGAVGRSAPNGFTTSVPYDVAVHIPTDGAPIDDRCAGETIQTGRVRCAFSTSGDNIALNSTARLTVTWQPQGGVPLAGEYVERLTVRVAAAI